MKNDRRRDFRFHPPNIKVTAGNLSLTLLDLGRAGMNIESRGPAPIACGDEYLFRLDDETDSVEVLGQVRWVDFPAADREAATGTPAQKAGVAFLEILSAAPSGIWLNLMVRQDPSPEEESEPRSEPEMGVGNEDLPGGEQLVEMVEPKDGATVASPVIEIVGHLDEAQAVVSITVNGVPATIEGNRFLSTVRLKSGENKISATLHRSTGGYSTCLLGTLKLDPRWKTARRWLLE